MLDIETTEEILSMTKKQKMVFIDTLKEQINFTNLHLNDFEFISNLSYDNNNIMNYLIKVRNTRNRLVVSQYSIERFVEYGDSRLRDNLDFLVKEGWLYRNKVNNHDVYLLNERRLNENSH